MPHWREALYGFIEQEAKPLEKFGHQPRLYILTKQIGRGLAYNDDVVYAAVWLHDLGVFYGHRPEDPVELTRWNNTKYAMERAPGILAGFGFPSEKIPAVVNAIQNHQASADPSAIEAVIIRDADILEQLGSIGVMRTVCKVGRDTRFSTFTQARDALERALQTLPQQLRLDTSRELAQPRIGLLREFLVGVDRESFGALF